MAWREMNGSIWKPWVGLLADKRSFTNRAGGDAVCDIDDLGAWVNTGNDTFHDTDKPVLCSEIGGQRDNGRF